MKHKLSPSQECILFHLSDTMGRDVNLLCDILEWGTIQYMAANLQSLRKRGLVTYIPDVKQWRITKEGREYVTHNN